MNKRFLFWILAMLLPLSEAAAIASLSIESFSINGGETKEMVIDLNNPATDITLVQFDLRLPTGLTLKQTDGEYDIDIAGRTTWRKHSLDANAQADGTIRVLLASSSNTVLSGSSGAIISITLVASSSFNHGDIKLENILMVSPDEKETSQPTYTYTIGNTPPAPVGTATLSIEDFTIEKGGEAEMVIELTNPDDEITLVQFDLRLPAGLSLKQVGGEYDFDIAGRTTWRKHSLDANEQADGSIRFLLASSSNTVLSGTEGAIIKVTLKADNNFTGGDIRLENILMVTPDEKEITQADYTYSIGTPPPNATAYLSIEPFSITAGETKEMVIDLTNPDDEITLVQFDLLLPTGLSLKQVGGEYDFDIAGRTTWRKHSLDANAQTGGSIRFLLASSSNAVLSGTEGAIIKMTLVAGSNYEDGAEIRLKDILLVTPNEKEINPADVTVKTKENDNTKKQGDVNGDKVVDEVDVEGVVNLILNRGDTSNLNRKAADINEDNIINVVDVAGVVNIIWGFDVPASTKAVTRAAGQPLLYFSAYPIGLQQTINLPIDLDSEGDSFTGCQFDLYLSGELIVAEKNGIPQVEAAGKNHVVSTSYQPDGTLRVVCYSNDNSIFKSGEIMTIAIHATEDAPLCNVPVKLRNITLSRPNVTGVTLSDYDNELMVFNPDDGDGIADVVDDQAANPVYSLSGQRLAAPRKGVNIVGGRKVVVK